MALFAESHAPSSIAFLSPNGVLITYAGTRLVRHGGADEVVRKLKILLADASGIAIGCRTGVVIGRLDEDDLFVGSPMGDVVNEAKRAATLS